MVQQEPGMDMLTLSPVEDIPLPASIAALPKADIHIHAEAAVRIERILATQQGQPARDQRAWVTAMMASTPPGMPRWLQLDQNRLYDRAMVDRLDADPALIIARIAQLLKEGAADGAILIAVLFGAATIETPGFMALFREAERQVQAHFPQLVLRR